LAGWKDFLWMDLGESPSEAFSNDGFVVAIPYLITIVLVMVTSYWQTAQTQRKAKEQQKDQQPQPGQAIMKIFPFFFGFISFNLPAGLVVYFAASAFFRIGQQALILRMSPKSEEAGGAPEPAPDAGGEITPPRSTETPRRKQAGGASPRPGDRSARSPQASKKRRGKKRKRR
jgi:membrane protein insertase Oxa1/YidC/SpoIIIJ